MPEIYDLFGHPVSDRSAATEQSRKARRCPFMEAVCDGGGNRHQTTIPLRDGEPLRDYFDIEFSSVIPGICSITAGSDTWVVCPRRLLAFKNDETAHQPPTVNKALQSYERDLLVNAGFPSGVEIGVWAEVSLKLKEEGVNEEGDADTNYHFDYIAAPLKRSTLRAEAALYGLAQESDIKALLDAARTGGLLPIGTRNPLDIPFALPDLTAPFILEVMTASTSGSNTARGTDIRGAFRNAILGVAHEAPGINKRQVWGRMVTQLFAKTALASYWNGKAIWIIQDELLRNIELTTRLKTVTTPPHATDNINLVVMHYEPLTVNQPHHTPRKVAFKAVHEGNAGVDFSGNHTYTDILLPGQLPGKVELLKAVLRRKIAAIVKL